MRRCLPALLLALLVLAPAASAQENPWLAERVRSFAHQGGEDENPSNTMYAYEKSLRDGADWLELDVNATSDGRIVAIHDTTLDRTTNGTGRVADFTLAEIQALDAAYWHVPGAGARRVADRQPTDTYPLRGVRTGDRPPPQGSTAQDFRVPTLEEVLERFPRIATNIEIKGESPEIQLRTAELLAPIIQRTGRDDIIVVSFEQAVVDRFHELAPDVPLAPGVGGGARFLLQNESPGPGVVAFQIPITFRFGDQLLTVTTPENVTRAHEAGYAVHVWLSNDTEDLPTYRRLLAMCVDAIMAAKPTLLERVLRRLDEDPCGTRVASGRPVARGGRVRLALTRRGLSEERRSGIVRLYGIDRSGRTQVVLGRGSWRLGSERDRTTASVRLNRLGRGAVRGRPRFVMRAIVSERGNAVSVRDISVG